MDLATNTAVGIHRRSERDVTHPEPILLLLLDVLGHFCVSATLEPYLVCLSFRSTLGDLGAETEQRVSRERRAGSFSAVSGFSHESTCSSGFGDGCGTSRVPSCRFQNAITCARARDETMTNRAGDVHGLGDGIAQKCHTAGATLPRYIFLCYIFLCRLFFLCLSDVLAIEIEVPTRICKRKVLSVLTGRRLPASHFESH
jgi:hypothetical protein